MVSIKMEYRKLYALSSGDIAGDLGLPPNLYVIAMTLSVLEGRFPTASLRTVYSGVLL